MERSVKVIVTNWSALRKKHGKPGMEKIAAAIGRLKRADARRGITTRLIAIDNATAMKPFGARVSNAHDARQAKRAVDEIYRALKPDYILLLGAPDVIPHVKLKNPMSVKRDTDRRIDSDLPYACDAPYSAIIKTFLGPTRVVGRLADVMGAGDTKYLVHIIDTACTWKSRPRTDYMEHFALSAEGWRWSTQTTTRKLFGETGRVRLSPSEGPYWTADDLRGRIHFFNCHGDTGQPEFYGEGELDDNEQPVSHVSSNLPGRILPATIAAAECCFGAELYQPIATTTKSIGQTYLAEGAWAFFGSTTVTYGPLVGNNFADLICGNFLSAVLDGASTGRAVLQARLKYVRLGGYMEMIDLKTIAQFILLGDPSIHPVQTATGAGAKKRRTGAKARRDVTARHARRKQLTRSGTRLGRTTASVASRPDAKPTARLRRKLLVEVAKWDANAGKIESFRLHAPKDRMTAPMGRQLVARHAVFHVIVLEEKPRLSADEKRMAECRAANEKRRPKLQRLLVVREVGGKIKRVVEAVRH